MAAALLFGSQFIFSKYCPGFRPGSYNITMALGILAGSFAALPLLGVRGLSPLLAVVAFTGGMVWVFGNFLLVHGVASAGMARAFVIVNFSAVFSFFGGIAFLGELREVTALRLSMIAGGIVLVMCGAFLVGTTTPRRPALAPGEKGRADDGRKMRRGLVAVFIATIFFSAYNVMIALTINRSGAPAGPVFALIAPGAVAGAFMVAAVRRNGSLSDWKAAPGKWHLLALSQGLVWATAMVCIMFGWMGTGIAMGTPIQVGTQTLVSSLWGILMFRELRGLENADRAYAKFAAGAALTVTGIAMIALF
jgi:glucose uptake protein GlcU